ncbi:MAG: MFS transporter [Myxococcota bacterium]|nr:MFS transporter [Myxococcota bacterium]
MARLESRLSSPAPQITPTPAPGAAAGRLPLGIAMAYGPPVVGAASMLFFVQFYFLNFATDVLLISPAVIGVVFALGRLWDALTDPLVGTWSDRTRSRLGRRRPWLFASAPLLWLTFAMVYLPPRGLSDTSTLVWVTIGLFAFYTALTGYLIPSQALGAELTDDHHDRSRVFGLRGAFFTLGMIYAFGGMQYVMNAPDPRAAAGPVVAVGVALGLLLLIPPWRVRERKEFQGRGSQRPLRAMTDVLRNPHARLLLFVQFVEMAGAGVLGILSPYLMKYILKRPDLVGVLPAIFVVFSVASIPVWVRLMRSYGKRNVWLVAMVLFAFTFGAIAFVQPGQWLLMGVLLFGAGTAAGCGAAAGPSILADVIDSDEYLTGERKEGAYSAAWGFAIKSANALVISLTGFALALAGFEPNAEQSREAEITLRALAGGLPFVLYLTGALLFSRFRLNEAEHARIRAELDRRREA